MNRSRIHGSINPDKPGTWIPYKKDLCNTCQATCCTQELEVTREDLLRLGEISQDEWEIFNDDELFKELKRRKIVEKFNRKESKFSIWRLANGDCRYLNSDRRCSVYEKRPAVCKNYPYPSSRPGFCPYIPK